MKNKILLLLFMMVILFSGCGKSSSETLAENLIENTWSTVTNDGTVSDMVFYENNTAVAGTGIFSKSYGWEVSGNQIILTYTSSGTLYTLTFDVEEDGEKSYIFNINNCQSEPNSDYYNEANM